MGRFGLSSLSGILRGEFHGTGSLEGAAGSRCRCAPALYGDARDSVFGIATVEITGAVVFVSRAGTAAESAFAPEMTFARNVVELAADAIRVLEENRVVTGRKMASFFGAMNDGGVGVCSPERGVGLCPRLGCHIV